MNHRYVLFQEIIVTMQRMRIEVYYKVLYLPPLIPHPYRIIFQIGLKTNIFKLLYKLRVKLYIIFSTRKIARFAQCYITFQLFPPNQFVKTSLSMIYRTDGQRSLRTSQYEDLTD